MELGEHGRLSPDEAREWAKKILGDVAKDKDTIAERRARQAVRPFKDVAEDFMRLHVAAKKKQRTNALKGAETVGVPWAIDEEGHKAKHLPKKKRATVVEPHAVAAIVRATSLLKPVEKPDQKAAAALRSAPG